MDIISNRITEKYVWGPSVPGCFPQQHEPYGVVKVRGPAYSGFHVIRTLDVMQSSSLTRSLQKKLPRVLEIFREVAFENLGKQLPH